MKSKRRNVQLVSDISIQKVVRIIVIIDLQRPPLLPSENSQEKTNRTCAVFFCNSINHPPWRCFKIHNPQHKRTVLKRNGLFLICFHKGHLASSCTLSNHSCNKYKGKHNISICIESEKPNNSNNTVLSDQSNTGNMNENNTNHTDRTTNNFTSSTTNNVNNVLLQTVKATASDLNYLSVVNIRIKFDSGSQQTSNKSLIWKLWELKN